MTAREVVSLIRQAVILGLRDLNATYKNGVLAVKFDGEISVQYETAYLRMLRLTGHEKMLTRKVKIR